MFEFKQCPLCGGKYYQPPAISRVDNETEICPDCGIRESLRAMGVSGANIEDLIFDMNNHGLEDMD